jgi:putative SOS response-associated peptidase YedK
MRPQTWNRATTSRRPIVPPSSAALKTGRTSFRSCDGAFHLSARPRGPPVINFRSEGRRFPVGRCLVPATHFFEFTGTKSPKAKWKFTKANEDWFCFAGLWRPITTGGEAFTLLTTEPSADVAPIHDRQMVVLERSDWSAWLEQTGNETDLLRALLAGSLKVEQVR